MSYDDESPFYEPFGADYEIPRDDCPNCHCCTARLCATATEGGVHCTVRTAGGDVLVVGDCQCTAHLARSGPELRETPFYKSLETRTTE